MLGIQIGIGFKQVWGCVAYCYTAPYSMFFSGYYCLTTSTLTTTSMLGATAGTPVGNRSLYLML